MWLALAAILLVAAALRFHGLSWGLRHVPDHDEIVFVDATRAMIRAGDLDHRFYEYPGLFIYMLAPVLAFFPPGGAVDSAAFLAARSFVGAFSVASVALVFFLARRLAGVSAGIFAAALMAVTPFEVWTMHMVRSDVVLETFVLATLLWLVGLGDRLRDDVWAGVAVGLTAAVKFTGVLIAPAYVAARCGRSGLRWGRMLLAGAVSALVWFAVTPYALIRPSAYRAGVWTQTDYFYGGATLAPHFLAYVDFYARALLKGIAAPPDAFGGPAALVPALGLMLLGPIVLRRAWRTWLPLIVYPAVLVSVLATAESRLSRLALSCVGPLVVMAGVGLAAVFRRTRPLGLAVAAIVVSLPLWNSVEVGRRFARPSSTDSTLEWIDAHVPRASRILSAATSLGIDAGRYEVVRKEGLTAAECPWALGMDWVVILGRAPDRWCPGLRSVATIGAEGPTQGPRFEIFRPEAAEWRAVAVRPEWLRASVSAEQLPALVDGDLHSVWQTPGPQTAGVWLEIAFPQPETLDRIEMVLGSRDAFARTLQILTRQQGSDWTLPRVFAGRPHVRDQPEGAAPPSQVGLLHAEGVSGVRIALASDALQPWSIAELRLARRLPVAATSRAAEAGSGR